MPYSRLWSNTAPPKTAQAKLIATFFNQLREDIDERFKSILKGNGLTEDPIALKDEVIGKLSKTLIIPAYAFVNTGGDQYFDDRILGHANEAAIYAPVILPVGVKITRVEVLLHLNNVPVLSWQLRRQSFDPNVGTAPLAIAESTVNQQGRRIDLVDNVNHVTDANGIYHIWVDSSNTSQDYWIYAVRISYDCPDSRYTL